MDLKYLFAKLVRKLQIPAIRNSRIDRTSRVCAASNIIDVEMGRYSYIGNNCTVDNATIGSFCSIGDNCIIGGAGHPLAWASTSPVFHAGRNILGRNFSTIGYEAFARTLIGNDVWIGDCCLVKGGVSIGDGAAIGMGSVVTRDVAPYSIVAGNPAKLIRMRFDDDTAARLADSRWWTWDDGALAEKAKDIRDPNAFIKAGDDDNEDRSY